MLRVRSQVKRVEPSTGGFSSDPSHVSCAVFVPLYSVISIASNHTPRRRKLDTLVQYPLEGLDLSKWVLDPQTGDKAVYDLFAVSVGIVCLCLGRACTPSNAHSISLGLLPTHPPSTCRTTWAARASVTTQHTPSTVTAETRSGTTSTTAQCTRCVTFALLRSCSSRKQMQTYFDFSHRWAPTRLSRPSPTFSSTNSAARGARSPCPTVVVCT